MDTSSVPDVPDDDPIPTSPVPTFSVPDVPDDDPIPTSSVPSVPDNDPIPGSSTQVQSQLDTFVLHEAPNSKTAPTENSHDDETVGPNSAEAQILDLVKQNNDILHYIQKNVSHQSPSLGQCQSSDTVLSRETVYHMKHMTNISEFLNNDFDDINLAISNLDSINDSGTTNYAIAEG